VIWTGERDIWRARPYPDVRDIYPARVARRWHELREPQLEYPPRLGTMASPEALTARADIQPPELAYVAQQMWPSLAELLRSASDRPRRWPEPELAKTPWLRELRLRLPSRRAAVGIAVGVLAVAAGTWCYWDTRMERDHYNIDLAEAFGYQTLLLEDRFQAQNWYRPPPWDAEMAIEQLVRRIAYQSEDDRYVSALEDAKGRARADNGGLFDSTWEIVFPPLPDVSIGETRWRIYQDGGYEYRNAQADKLAHCAGISIFYEPADGYYYIYTSNERELPCED
jgi:hypothetical protein